MTLLARSDVLPDRLDAAAPWLLPTLARFVFLPVLFTYYWNAATGKLDGPFQPTFGAFGAILPRVAEAVSYDLSQATLIQKTILILGAWAEYALPLLLVAGLATRLAALGMVGFVVVQSLTDIHGHGVADIGAWFDNVASATILDQRTLWVFLLLVLVVRGAGPLSLDAALTWLRRRMQPQPA